MREFLLRYPEILDAWVKRRVSIANGLFKSDFFAKRRIYVPMPIWMGDQESGKRVSSDPKPQDFQPLFNSERLILSIEGDGGTGKSTLACQLARWAFSLEDNLAPHRILSVILDEDISDPVHVETAIVQRLRQVIGHEETETDIIIALLKQKRLMVIVDALSERLPCTQEAIDTIHSYTPINLLIVTTRHGKLTFGNQPVIRLHPEKLNTKQLVYFMTEYIKRTGNDQYFSPSDPLVLGKKLLDSVQFGGGETRVTPLLIKLFIENAVVAVKRGESLDNMPMSIPETILNYLREVNPQDTNAENYVPNLRMLAVAKAVAWLMLKDDYVPRNIQRLQIKKGLSSLLENCEDTDVVLDRLRANGVIEQTEVGGEPFISFSLDPVAEYLSAIYQVNYLAGDKTKWRKWLTELQSAKTYPDEMSGFLYSLQICVNTYKKHFNIPEINLPQINLE